MMHQHESSASTRPYLFSLEQPLLTYQDRKFETFLDYLVRAVANKDKIEDRHFKDIKTDAWEKMSCNERRKEVAYVALSAMYKTADIK